MNKPILNHSQVHSQKCDRYLDGDTANAENQVCLSDSDSPKNLSKDHIISVIQIFWQRFSTWLAQRQDIQVHQYTDRFGHICWKGYNPVTGRSLCSGSELEVRTWIEQELYW